MVQEQYEPNRLEGLRGFLPGERNSGRQSLPVSPVPKLLLELEEARLEQPYLRTKLIRFLGLNGT
jgi:hypothetical protein